MKSIRILLQCVIILAAGAAFAADDCAVKQTGFLPMTPYRDGRMAVSLLLNDRPSWLLFDTGGAVRSLMQETVRALGLKTYRSDITLYNIGGKQSDQEVTVSTVTLGGLKVHDVHFLVFPPGMAPPARGPAPSDAGRDAAAKPTVAPSFDGIFTIELLKRADVELDFKAHKLNIFSQDHCKGRVVYWPADTIAEVPFTLDQTDHINFPVEVDGHSLNAILDTGAVTTTMDLALASKFDLHMGDPDTRKVGRLNGEPVYQHRFKSLGMNGIAVSNPMITLIPNFVGRSSAPTGSHMLTDTSRALPQVIVGMSILSKLRIYIAMKEEVLYITAASSASAPPP